MEYFLFYLSGSVAFFLFLGVHALYTWITTSSQTKRNYKKIGVTFSFLAERDLENEIKDVLMMSLLSWLAVIILIFYLFFRIAKTLKSLGHQPEKIKDLNYYLSNYDLSAEEVFLIDIKLRSGYFNFKVKDYDLTEGIKYLAFKHQIILNHDAIFKIAIDQNMVIMGETKWK